MVIIAEAGPTGLALACGLRKFGVDEVRVVDAASGPATTSRALAVQPRGAEVLTRLGALGDLPEKAIRMKALRINGRKRLDLTPMRGAGTLVASQTWVEQRLRDRLAGLGVAVEWNTPIASIPVRGDDWLVGAVDWESTFRIHRRLASAYRRGNVLPAGDPAHIHSPLGGQVMNTGLGDAENLAWKLALVAQGRAAASLLDTHEAERRPVAAKVLGSTTPATRISMGSGRATRLVRGLLFPLLGLPPVQRGLIRFARRPLLGAGGCWRGPRSAWRWRGNGSATSCTMNAPATRCWCVPTDTWRGAVRLPRRGFLRG